MKAPEPWLRGPVPDIPPLLQPVAHALLLAVEDVRRTVDPLPVAHLWARPGGAPRGVGRRQLPSTVLGLLVHTAEHTQRHVGQIITTARIVTALAQ